jgi:hypothetical protein
MPSWMFWLITLKQPRPELRSCGNHGYLLKVRRMPARYSSLLASSFSMGIDAGFAFIFTPRLAAIREFDAGRWPLRLLAMDGQLAAGLFKGGDVLESRDRQAQVEFGEEGAEVVSQALCAAV